MHYLSFYLSPNNSAFTTYFYTQASLKASSGRCNKNILDMNNKENLYSWFLKQHEERNLQCE
jgi:hypothetical protein